MDFEIQKNVLHDYVELLRGKKWNETGSALHNVIRTMRYSRQNRICGEDFSCLDFGNFPLNEIYWSDDGKLPCIFDKSVFYQETFLLDDGHNPYYVVFSKYSNSLLSIDMRNFTVVVRERDSMLSVMRFTLPFCFKYNIMANENGVIFVNDKKDSIVTLNVKKKKIKKLFKNKDGKTREYMETLRSLKEHQRDGKIKEICAYIWVDMLNIPKLNDAEYNERQLKEYSKESEFLFDRKKYRIILKENGYYIFVYDKEIIKSGYLQNAHPSAKIIDACFSHDGKYCAIVFNSPVYLNSNNRVVVYQIESNKFIPSSETTHFELKPVDDCIFSGEDIIAYSTKGRCLIKWTKGKVNYSQTDIEYDNSIFNSLNSFNWFRDDIHFWDVQGHDNYYVSDKGITNDPSEIKIDISTVHACAISRNGDMLYLPFDPLNQTQDNVFRYTFESQKCVNIKLPFNNKPYNQPLPSVSQRGLVTIALSNDNSVCAIGSMEGCIYLFDEYFKTLYDTLYMLPDIHLTGCSFNNIIAPEIVKKIIIQNNGKL